MYVYMYMCSDLWYIYRQEDTRVPITFCTTKSINQTHLKAVDRIDTSKTIQTDCYGDSSASKVGPSSQRKKRCS